MKMAEKRKPLFEGYPPRYPSTSSSPLFLHPWHNSYHAPSNYFYHASSNRPIYPNAHYMNGYRPYSHSPSMYQHGGFAPIYSTPLNLGGGRPLLPKPPPLMLPPHMYGRHPKEGFSLQQCSQGPQGSGAQSMPSLSCQSQKSPNEEAEHTEHQLSNQRLVPLMPSVPAEFLSHPKFIKTFSFFKDCDVSGGLQEGEMVIRGFLYDIDASGDKGYLKSGSNLEVEINKDHMYVMGRKMRSDENFRDVLADSSNIKALVKEVHIDYQDKHTSKLEEGGDEVEQSAVRYKAVLAWFGEIPSVKGLMPTVKVTQYLEKAKGIDDSSSESSLSDRFEESSKTESNENYSSEIAHILGYVWWADKDQGVMRIYQAKGWGSDFSGILFRTKVLHFKNQQARCNTLHFLVAHLNKCDVQARRIKPRILHGMFVNWEAIHIECGDVNNYVSRNEPDLNLSGISHDTKRNWVESNSPLECIKGANVHLSTCMEKLDILSTYSEGKIYDCDSYVDNDKYSFREVAGRNGSIKSLGKEEKDSSSAEKSWYNEDLFFTKDLQNSCNNDIADLQQNGKAFEVLFCNKYSGKHLTGHIVKLFSSNVGIGIAQWKSMDYGNVNIIFKQNDLFVDLIPINKIMQLSPSLHDRCCNLFVLPVKGQDCLGYRVQLVATCGWLGAKPSCIPIPGEQPKAKILLNHLESIPPAEDGNASGGVTGNQQCVKTSLLFNTSSSRIKGSINGSAAGVFKKKNSSRSVPPPMEVVSFDDEEEADNYQSGEIVEVHCKIGKLLSSVGEYYYFNREQCFLFGLNLCHVELWHVLVHGQKILFTLEMHPKVKAKIDKVFIGSKDHNEGANIDIEHFVEWCKNNAVTDCAKDILVKQLQTT